MRLIRKRRGPTRLRGIARVAAEGASREELIREALNFLGRAGGADRFGVWLQAEESAAGRIPEAFQGAVWQPEEEETPREWMHLAPEFLLPMEQLFAGKAVRQEQSGKSQYPLLGPATGLRVVLWVPVRHANGLLGILLGGSRKAAASLPIEAMEGAAAELSLSLQLQRERRLSQHRLVDMKLCEGVLGRLGEGRAPQTLLKEIVESCTEGAAAGGPGAQCAAIARRRDDSESSAELEGNLEFVCTSGKMEWKGVLESELLAGFWNRALDSNRTIGMELNSTPAREARSRAVAIPLAVSGRPMGLLAAILETADASLASLERLELRGSLAAETLASLRRLEKDAHRDSDEQALLDASEEALVVVDKSFRPLFLNRSMRERFGDALGGCETKPIADWFRVHDRAREDWTRDLQTDQEPPREPLEVEFHNGKRIKLRQEGRTGRGTILSLEPLADSEAVDEPRASAELATLIEWLDQGAVLFGPGNKVRGLNPRFAQLFGLPPEETRNPMTFEELIGRIAARTADPEIFAKRWREVENSNEAGAREEVHLAKPVSRVLERVSRPVFGPRGTRLGRIELYRDLTSQRVLQSRLLHTEKLAALGQMISGVAHELSNPLTSIVGYAQRLLLSQDKTGRREEVHRIFAEAERAAAILRQILLSARETPPDRRPLSMNQIIQRTAELQRFSLAAEKIHLEMDLDPLIPPILGDAGQMQQVLLNLFGNARQAIESQGKGGVIRVNTSRMDGGGRIRLEISDTGPGIPDEILGRIFDPFFTTKPAGVGTGLGLAIVLGIVREHGGQVFVKSPPGKGAVLTIDLPASASAPQASEPYPVPQAAQRKGPVPGPAAGVESPPRSGAVRRALVVEDEPTVAQLISDVLQDEGFRVDIVLNGREAQMQAKREEFDLVICDMKMPGFDGAQFYRALVREENPLQQRFLFVTGDVLGAHTQQFLEQTGIPYVAKPFRVEELMDKVHRVLAGTAPKGAISGDERRNIATKG